jgi:hypothetical protein
MKRSFVADWLLGKESQKHGSEDPRLHKSGREILTTQKQDRALATVGDNELIRGGVRS